MAGSVGHPVGGILSLLELIDAHGEALEFDLIGLGLRLRDAGSRRFSWRDLWVVVRQSPTTSALARAVHGERVLWSAETHLLAHVADLLAAGNWQRAGRRNAQKPKPVPRPGQTKTQTIGSAPVSVAELESWIESRERGN